MIVKELIQQLFEYDANLEVKYLDLKYHLPYFENITTIQLEKRVFLKEKFVGIV